MSDPGSATAGPAGASAKITLEDLIHVGEGTICGRFLRTFWHPVIPVKDIPAGTTKPLRIMGEDFTLYRGESGEVHAVANRCAHRGTQLSTGWVEGECIRCLYHGWKYDAAGQCVEQPDEDSKFAHRIKIRSYPARTYLGLVFVYFGPDEPPELPRLNSFEGDDGILETDSYQWPCSYLNGHENDSYHGNWVHREQYAEIGRLPEPGGFNVDVEQTSYGFVSRIERRGARRFRKTQTYNIMPNLRMRRSSGGGSPDRGWQQAARWSVPVDDSHFVNVHVTKTHVTGEAAERFLERQRQRAAQRAALTPAPEVAESILRGEARLWDFPGKGGVLDPRMFNIGDYVTQVGQGPFSVMNDSHLGRGDVEVAMLRRLYRRELQALAEGRPLTRWVIPDDLNVRVSED